MGVSATLQSGRYTLSYPMARLVISVYVIAIIQPSMNHSLSIFLAHRTAISLICPVFWLLEVILFAIDIDKFVKKTSCNEKHVSVMF